MTTTAAPPDTDDRRRRSAQALERLLDGNARFADGGGAARRPVADPAQRTAAQHPIAQVLACVDSRVPVETVLDQDLGTLLVTRTAGQSAVGPALASLQFGAGVLDIPLVVVLGHTRCGAVTAAVEGPPADAPAALAELVAAIASRVGDAQGDEAAAANVAGTVAELRADPSLAGTAPVWVAGLLYDLATGRVTVIDDAGLATDPTGT